MNSFQSIFYQNWKNFKSIPNTTTSKFGQKSLLILDQVKTIRSQFDINLVQELYLIFFPFFFPIKLKFDEIILEYLDMPFLSNT